MKIVNFVKHPNPIQCGLKKKMQEIACFDIEFDIKDAVLVWQGWSIRELGNGDRFLQAAHMRPATTRRRGACVLIRGVNPAVMLGAIRSLLLQEHGIKVPEPKKPIQPTETKSQSAPPVENPAPTATDGPKIEQSLFKGIREAGSQKLRQIKNKGPNK